MRIKLQLVIEHDDGLCETHTEEVGTIERTHATIENVGLTLAESKRVLAAIQEHLVRHQVADWIDQHRHCSACGQAHRRNGHQQITYRTLFGKLRLTGQRFYNCPCQSTAKKTFSPIVSLLPERTAPELNYLQTKWAGLVSYGQTVNLLAEVLPMQTNVATVHNKTLAAGRRLEAELDEERTMFIDGCERDWKKLPRPAERLVVGLDGGFVHARDGDNRKAGWFEVMVGKSLQDNHPSKCMAFVQTYDTKPKRRLYEMLRSQGLQMNQAITFLSDGADDVRDLQSFLSPEAEHILDWFHVTMKITVMRQMLKSLPLQDVHWPDLDERLERLKWYLWHGNVIRVLDLMDDLPYEFESCGDPVLDQQFDKLAELIGQFVTYIENNLNRIPNYGDRYRYGEPISSSFAESAVNAVVSRRMVKKQQMRWTTEGAHLLLQVRTKTLNEEWRDQFVAWYPGMAASVGECREPQVNRHISC